MRSRYNTSLSVYAYVCLCVHGTAECYWGASALVNFENHLRGQQQGVKVHFWLFKTCIEATCMDQFKSNLALSLGIPLEMFNGGQYLYITPGVKTCMKSTCTDRFNPNLAFSFGITLWRFEEGQLFFIKTLVKLVSLDFRILKTNLAYIHSSSHCQWIIIVLSYTYTA
jgi:hypothetical protein